MRRLYSWARLPWFWVLLQVGAIWAYMAVSGQLEPREHIDSRLYLNLAKDDPVLELLGRIRSLGYPLLLRSLLWLRGDLGWLPHLQVLLFGAAAAVWCAALRRFGLSSPAALVAGSWPIYSQLFRELAAAVMSDVPAAAVVLLALSAFLVLLREPRRRALWVAVGGVVFLAYQLRPAYVFLVALLPCAVWALGWLERRWGLHGEPRRPMAWRLGLVTLLPLLLFCGLRWALVGHFGLVPFTGHNLSGITSSMLTSELVAELPAKQQPLASAILAERQRRKRQPLDARSSFDEWERFYIWNSWGNAIGVVKAEWKRGFAAAAASGTLEGSGLEHRDVYIEKRLLSHCLAVLRARPSLYLAWLGRAWGHTLLTTARQPWIYLPAALCLGAWALTRRRGDLATKEEPRQARSRAALLGLFALAFYLVAMGLVLLIETPFWRYSASAELLLPGALLALAVELVRPSFGGPVQ